MRSGAYSPRVAGPLAAEKLATLLADPMTPARLRVPQMRPLLERLALAEAQAELLWLHIDDTRVADPPDVPPWAVPRRAGGSTTALELHQAAEDRALRLREELGLDPVSLILEARQAEADGALEALAAEGARIVARRRGEERGET